MRPMSAEMVESFLKKNGFRLVSSKGSHFKWENQATGKWTIVPHHGNRLIQQGTLNAIFSQAGIPKPQR